MKKKKGFWGLILAAMLLSGCGEFSFKTGEAVRSISIFAREPAQVTELRAREVPMEDEGHLEYYFRQLSGEEQRIYREILAGVREYQNEVYLSSAKGELIDRAYHALLRDHPEIFWIHSRELVYKTTYRSYTVFEPGICYTEEEIEQGLADMEAAWQQVNALIPDGAGDYQKARTVYSWIIQNTEYGTSRADQNIEGVFGDHLAVCAGYAGAAQYLLERLGISCIYVAGESAVLTGEDRGHAWNLALLDGSWYYMDVTNGDLPDFIQGTAAQEGAQPVIYDYLCPFPGDYESIVCPDGEFVVPECTETAYNDAVLNGGIFDYYDYNDVMNYAYGRISQGEEIVRMKFLSEEEFQNAERELLDNEGVQHIARYYLDYTGFTEIQYHYGVLEDLKTLYLMF